MENDRPSRGVTAVRLTLIAAWVLLLVVSLVGAIMFSPWYFFLAIAATVALVAFIIGGRRAGGSPPEPGGVSESREEI
jgi:hypothetical protein